ncbi:MAG TPA: hypothetical protein VN253_12735 [Kofleriaceae bacterium]|nr:hypothetical protein [Kofleriaceae bacterium]
MLAAIMVAASRARADAGKPEAKPDWARGLVLASAVGIADRHAPSPIAARGPARRAAEEAARKQLAAALPALPLAEGGTLAAKLADAAVKARVDRAVAAALVVDAEPSTDGSWNVTLGVPIEAIRQALAGPRPVPASDSEGPEIVVVNLAVGNRPVAPAIGYKLGQLAAPTIWVKDVPAWAKDAPRVSARAGKSGVLELTDPKGSESTLWVIVSPR